MAQYVDSSDIDVCCLQETKMKKKDLILILVRQQKIITSETDSKCYRNGFF